MRLINFLFSTALVASTLSAFAQDPIEFPELKRWDLKVSSDVYTPDNLWDLINGAAESYLAYDFVDLHLADYQSKDGITIHAEVYRHSSLNNAFGIYSSERSPEYDFIALGGEGYLDEGVLNCFSGPYYIKLYSTDDDPAVQEALEKVGKSIVKSLGEGNFLPELLGIFPDTGKLPYSEHYIAQNFLGFDFLHSAFTAEYEQGYKFFLIEGQDAGEILKMVSAYLSFTKQDIDPSEELSFTIKDKYNGDIPVIISGEYLVGIQDGGDTENMKSVLSGFERILRAME